MRRVILSIISPNEQRGGWGEGGGGVGGECALPDFLFFNFFPCSADHERDWPPCKVFFSWLAINALNVRNNNNNNNNNMHIYGSSKNCTSRENVSPLSRLIRGFRNKYH